MKIKKGLPAGYMAVKEDLQPLVRKMHRLKPRDYAELEAFIDYLLKGREALDEFKPKGKVLKIFDFMNGGS